MENSNSKEQLSWSKFWDNINWDVYAKVIKQRKQSLINVNYPLPKGIGVLRSINKFN